jgi:predicted nucleic acid-binding protein
VVLDANVLFSAAVRDTLLRAAARGLIQVYWSDEILDELVRNLMSDRGISVEQAGRLRAAVVRAFPEATVTGYESLVLAMPNDEKDRHVAAAAVLAVAHRIVTFNLDDFAALPEGIEACHPDDLLLELFERDPADMVDLLREQAAALARPSRTVGELLNGLARQVPSFAVAVREHVRDEAGSD